MNNFKSNTETSNDSLLWVSLKAGDEEAFSLLFERYYASLVGYGNTLMVGSDKVKDCVQDVFVDIWTYRHSINEAVVVKAYLLSSVRKRIARLHERDRVFRHTNDLDSVEFLFDFSIEEGLIADETMGAHVEQLNRLVNALPPRQKEILYLRYHQGLSVEQITQMLNVNYQSVKNLLHRALLQLRKKWSASVLFFFLLISPIL